MKSWREKRKGRRRRHKEKSNFWFSLLDLITDILFWVPELLLFLLRMMMLLFRGVSRALKHLFDW